MRIRRKFLQLTKSTYPYGTETLLEKYLPKGYKEDGLGNYYLEVGNNSTTMFACHLDTACSKKSNVKHVFNGKYIETDGTTILGADDKAGMVVALYMIEKKIPGLYYFFIGEEVGCVGSNRLSLAWENTDFSSRIKKVISFDRRGTDSIITDQLYGESCSMKFANELARRLNNTKYGLNLSPDPTGIYTDSAEFMDIVPECTNISVGYYNEHTVHESQDIDFLGNLCRAVCEINWEDLPIHRDPTMVVDYSNQNTFNAAFKGEKWSYENFSYFLNSKGDVEKLYISNEKILDEKNIILHWLNATGNCPGLERIKWNGEKLYVVYSNNEEDYLGNRMDLCKYIPDLKTIDSRHLLSKLSTY